MCAWLPAKCRQFAAFLAIIAAENNENKWAQGEALAH
jgi:hypothetical protein